MFDEEEQALCCLKMKIRLEYVNAIKRQSSLLIFVCIILAYEAFFVYTNKCQAGASIPFYVYYESSFNKKFITCFILSFDMEIKAINIQRQKEMYFLIRYIYNNLFYYKSDSIVKILVRLRPLCFIF